MTKGNTSKQNKSDSNTIDDVIKDIKIEVNKERMNEYKKLKPVRADIRKYIYIQDMETDINNWLDIRYSLLGERITKRGSLIQFMKPPLWDSLLSEGLGMSKSTAHEYLKGKYDDADNKYSELLTHTRDKLWALLQEGGLIGLYDTRLLGLIGQSFYGYSTKSETRETKEQKVIVMSKEEYKEQLTTLQQQLENPQDAN